MCLMLIKCMPDPCVWRHVCLHAYRAERQNKIIRFEENTHISCKFPSWIKGIKNAKVDLLFSVWRSARVSMRRETRAGDNRRWCQDQWQLQTRTRSSWQLLELEACPWTLMSNERILLSFAVCRGFPFPLPPPENLSKIFIFLFCLVKVGLLGAEGTKCRLLLRSR